MITVCHPVDDLELLLLEMELQTHEIPYFVVGRHFGSLYPGVQVPWYNERSIRVGATHLAEAEEVVGHVRSYYEPAAVNLAGKSKLRIFCEAVIAGWAVPAGKKRRPTSAR